MSEDLDAQLIEAARHDNPQKVHELIEKGADANVDDSLPLFWASKNGNLDLVNYLIPLCDVTAYHNEALRIAHANKHWQVCESLLPHCNPLDAESMVNPLHLACTMQHSHIVHDYLDQYDIDVAAQIKHMQAKKYSAESVALLESVVQSRVLRKKIGEELSLSNSNTSFLGAKRKI